MKNFAILGAVLASLLWTGFFSHADAQPRPTRDPVSQLAYLNGSWISTPSIEGEDGERHEAEFRGFVDFEFTLDRNIIEGDFSPLPDLNIHSRLFVTYDVVRDFYRVISMDDYWGWVLVMTGDIDEDGRLVVDNVGTETSWRNSQGGFTDTRMMFERIDDNHVRITSEWSHDAGETWSSDSRLDLHRRYPQ